MPRLVVGVLLVAAAEVVAGLALAEPALLGSALLTAGFGVLLLVAGSMIGTVREGSIGLMLAISVFVLGLGGSILIPGAAIASAMLPILAFVLVLPGRGRRRIGVVLGIALLGSVASLLAADFPHPFPPMREPLGSVFSSATLLGVAMLILGALTDFAMEAKASFDGMHAAMRSQDDSFAERTAIVASIARLERQDTIEATAAVIVDELMKLPGIDVAGVMACGDDAIEILAMTGPASFPARTGQWMPARRARHLLERSLGGPWAERWLADPAFGEYGSALTESGIKGQAYAPFYSGGNLIGIVAIGATSQADADHLVADLPAVAEFAVTSSLLLAPMLLARRDTAAARRSILEIVAGRTFRTVFQPIVELESSRIVGFEALTRFDDGRRPDFVFDAAARAGVGLNLEFATLEAAVYAARDLPGGTWLSLNASPSVVAATGLPAILALRDRPVVLEITEHVAIDDYGTLRSGIGRLGAGLRVAVDDAGAGIANFSHLVELSPHFVKVDAGLIRDLDRDLARQAAVVGFVHFAARAGSEVIAEGIETEAERRTASDLGVTHGQGYLLARPAPAASFIGRDVAIPLMRRTTFTTRAHAAVLTN